MISRSLTIARFLDWIRRPVNALLTRLAKVWVIGTLFKCRPKTIVGAFYELVHGVVFATMPFWLSGIVLLTYGGPPDSISVAKNGSLVAWAGQYWMHVRSTFSGGELLVFAISLLTPTLWLTMHEPEGAEPLPHRRPLSTLAIIVIIVGAVIFTLNRQRQGINLDIVFGLSVGLTFAAFFLRYLVLVYHGYRMPRVSERDLAQPREAWMKSVDLHRSAAS